MPPLFFGILDSARGTFQFSNAGHNYPLWRDSSGDIRYLEKGGLLLGVLEQTKHEEEMVTLSSGDIVVFYTDGLTEAANKDEIMYGEGRLEEIIRKKEWGRAEDLLQSIIKEVEAFCGRTTYDDDVTLVVLKVQ